MDQADHILKNNKEKWTKEIESMKEMILANLVMIAQTPAKTFEEQERSAFVLDRLIECGLDEPTIDEIGNVIARIPGKSSRRTVVLSAHLDTLFDGRLDHNVTITKNQAEGLGIADNALGVTFLLTLPDILQRLDLQLESDLVLLFTVHSKERGDLAGVRHFFKNHGSTTDLNLNIEGISLGQIDHSALSRVRCDIKCILDTDFGSSWRGLGQNSAIMMLNDIMDGLFSIPLPRKPKTVMNVGRILGGNSYSRVCGKASLSLEVRSEDDKVTESLVGDIRDICHDIGAKYGVEIEQDFFSRQHAAGIKFSHPLVRSAAMIVKDFGIKPRMGPSNSEIAVPLSMGIPSVTLGLTSGEEDSSDRKSYIKLKGISNGIAQVLLLLTIIDEGYCDDES